MRFGSICSGIEAASVASAHLGWEAAWLAEVDVAASAVLAHRLGATAPLHPLPGSEKALKKIAWRDRVTNWGDMTVLPVAVREGRAEAPELLCGGTPCQGFSIAGLRGGLADPRGQLTLSFVELANAIDDTRVSRGQQPCVIFWENVPGVRSDETGAFGHFLAALVGVDDPIEPGPRPEHGRSSAHWTWKKEAGQHIPKWPSAGAVAGPRRTVAWRSLDAQFFGLAQRRERVFVVGSAREGFDPQEILFEFDGVRRDSAPSRDAGQEPAGTFAASTYRGGISGKCEAGLGYVQPHEPSELDAFRMVAFGEYAHDGSASTLKARDYKDATDLVVSVALRGREGGGTAELGDDVAGTLRASGGGGDKPHVLTAIPILEAGARTGVSTTDSRAGMGIGQADDPMFTLQAGKQHAVAFAQNTRDELRLVGGDGQIVGALAAQPGMKQQTFICVHGTQHPITSVDLAHTLGRNSGEENAVCVTGDVTHTLTAEGFDASEDCTGMGQPIVAFDTYNQQLLGDVSQTLCSRGDSPGGSAHLVPALLQDMAVRRLMPVECERLQGFPMVTEWDLDNMTRDEVIVAALLNGDIVVNPETGEVFGTRGPGGHPLAEPRRFDGVHPSGYRIANLTANGQKRQVRLHRVVWISQFGVPPEGFIVAHKDNDKTHNAILNLKLLTPAQNTTEAFGDGLVTAGDEHPITKLPVAVRKQLWSEYHSGGVTYSDLMAKYGISKSRVGQIVNETGWTDVPIGNNPAADGPRYKQLGNSWAVNCVAWIFERIDAHVANLDAPQRSTDLTRLLA